MGSPLGVSNLRDSSGAPARDARGTADLWFRLASCHRRTIFLPWVYGFFVLDLWRVPGVASTFGKTTPGSRARSSVWLSVFNLFVLSVFWSFWSISLHAIRRRGCSDSLLRASAPAVLWVHCSPNCSPVPIGRDQSPACRWRVPCRRHSCPVRYLTRRGTAVSTSVSMIVLMSTGRSAAIRSAGIYQVFSGPVSARLLPVCLSAHLGDHIPLFGSVPIW